MKLKNIINLLRLYWLENRRILLLLSLGIFLLNIVIESWFYFGVRDHQIKIVSPLSLMFFLFLPLYYRKTVAIPTTRYSDMILSARPIEKWVVSFFIIVPTTYIICFLFPFLGQLSGAYFVSWLRYNDNINIELMNLKDREIVDLFTINFWALSAIVFLLLKMSSAKSLVEITTKNWKAILIVFLSYVVLWESILLLRLFEMYTFFMKIVVLLLLGTAFWIANYFVIKNKQLK